LKGKHGGRVFILEQLGEQALQKDGRQARHSAIKTADKKDGGRDPILVVFMLAL